MDIKRVDHYSIRTRDLESSRRFYTEVIGLKEGPRPPHSTSRLLALQRRAARRPANSAQQLRPRCTSWDRDDANPGSLDEYVGERKVSAEGGTGSLDHVAFAATGYGGDAGAVHARPGVKFHERDVPLLGLRQVFIQDPDGVTIEAQLSGLRGGEAQRWRPARPRIAIGVSAVAQGGSAPQPDRRAGGRGRARHGAAAAAPRGAMPTSCAAFPMRACASCNEIGLMRLLQPRRVGGSEADWVSLIDVSSELARGCGSTAWNWANWAVHHWMLALWPRQCQDEAWGADPAVLMASAILFPPGKASTGRGRLSAHRALAVLERSRSRACGTRSARWSKARASCACSWCRSSDYRVIDNWRVLGLRGTGQQGRRGEGCLRSRASHARRRRLEGRRDPSGRVRQSRRDLPHPLFAALPHMLVRHPARHCAGRLRRRSSKECARAPRATRGAASPT